ncbi:MAG: SirB2 family protein [Proteobacteria bacterium]|nr:SirB2 family protein [Pseudomonadota bacterium]
MTVYTLLYMIHVGAVALSGGFFLVRGIWMLLESPQLEARVTRIAPHVIDTVLLASAIALAIQVGQYPLVNDWLTVKVLALVLYIGLGLFALRRAKTKALRSALFFAAVGVFLFMVSVALTRDPAGFLAYLA